jgi:hypothetical protein
VRQQRIEQTLAKKQQSASKKKNKGKNAGLYSGNPLIDSILEEDDILK